VAGSSGETDPTADVTTGGAAARLTTAVLGWMTDRLARTVLDASRSTGATDDPSSAWGEDAAAFAPAYWHWQHEWSLSRRREVGDHAGSLPSTGPLLSVVVPVFRPPVWLLRECVRSVTDQTYTSWELCLCDDGSDDPGLRTALAELSAADPRIKVSTLEHNGGIARATNRALDDATGLFVALVDQDDTLDPEALAAIASVVTTVEDADVVYSDEDKLDEFDRPFHPLFKPDWDPDLLLSYPYLGHLTAVRLDLLRRLGGFRSEFDGSQDYDVMLRATEVARRVVHIPRVLYHWRVVPGSAAGNPEGKPWAHAASRRALDDALIRRGIEATVDPGPFRGAYHVRRRVLGAPTVSVIIPFRDQAALTVACVDSLERDPGYPVGEVVLVDNGSTEPETRVLRARLEQRPATRVLDAAGPFNWAAINNAAAATCRTDMLLFMNNDIEATAAGWLNALVEQGQRPEIGAVGARLLYPDGSVQHAGVVLGMQGIAAHLFGGLPPHRTGYSSWDRLVRTYSAVTGACMLVRRAVFEEVGGFDEVFPVAFNDIDFCLRLERAGYRQLYTPHAELTHYESVSRGLSGYSADYQAFLARWGEQIQKDDPRYNRNLGRFAPWCPLRAPDEDERWLASIRSLMPATPAETDAPATGDVPDPAGREAAAGPR
jgi:GT2 family glycosyltransferase